MDSAAVDALGQGFVNVRTRLKSLESQDLPVVLRNLAPNGGFDSWPLGTGPFTTTGARITPAWSLILSGLTGNTASVSRDSTNKDFGSVYDAAVTYVDVPSGYARLQQTLGQPTLYADRTLALSVRARFAGTARAYISTDGGTTLTYSDPSLVGGGSYETLSVVVVVPAVPGAIIFGIELSGASGTAYLDNVFLTNSDGAYEFRPMTESSDSIAEGYLLTTEITTPATPAANSGILYTKDLTGVSTPYWMGDNGTEFNLLVPTTFGPGAGVALTKTDDTNVTLTLAGDPTHALVHAASITVGWSGTLAAARLNANVVQSVVNDTNVTGSIATQALTLGWTGTLAVARGGTGSSTAAGARTNLGIDSGGTGDIWVHRGGDTMTGTLTFTDNTIDIGANAATSPRTVYAATSVIVGRVSAASGSIYLRGLTSGQVRIRSADIAGTWDWTVPTSNGTNGYALLTDGAGVSSWAQVNLTTGVTGVLPIANGGTGFASVTDGRVLYTESGGIATLSRFLFSTSAGVDQFVVGATAALENPTTIFATGISTRAGGFQRDDTTTTLTSNNGTVVLYNMNTTANNWAQITAKTYDTTGTPVIRPNASIKFITTARTAGTVTGQLSFHTNNASALNLTQIATLDSTGLNVIVGSITNAALTASRLVATDASKVLVSTITVANLVSSVSDLTGSTGTGNLVLSASPTFTGTVTTAAISATTVAASTSITVGGASGTESSFRRDTAGTPMSSSTAIVALRNDDTTNNNGIHFRFLTVDVGATLRNVGMFGVVVTDHTTSALVSKFQFWTNLAALAPTLRAELGGTSADSSTYFILSNQDTSVSANQVIGQIKFQTLDVSTTTNSFAAMIEAQAANTITTDINPGRLIFYTTPTTVAGALTERLRIDEAGAITIAEAGNVILGTTTGTKFGTATTQKLAFYNATPIVQGAAFTQTYSTAASTLTQTTMTDPAAYGAGANGYSTAAMAQAIHAEVIALKANVVVTQNVLNQVIDLLQALGLFA